MPSPRSCLLMMFGALLCTALCAEGDVQGTEGDGTEGDVHIEYHYPVFSAGGYSSEGTSFSIAMDELLGAVDPARGRWSLSLHHHGDGYNWDYVRGLDEAARGTLQRLSSARAPPGAARVIVCHSEPGAWNVLGGPAWSTPLCPPAGAAASGAILVGRTMFETDRLPGGWPERLNEMDEIWVPTSFHERVFASGGVEAGKLRVLGEGVDDAFFRPVEALFRKPAGIVAFVSVFKFEERKGWQILVDAVLQEFVGGGQGVRLLVLTSGYHQSEEELLGDLERHLRAAGREYEVSRQVHEESGLRLLTLDFGGGVEVVVTTNVPQQLLPAFYASGDAFVLPSRGEGWGRPHMEAMACGVPVVATNWSGPTEFVTEQNGWLIEVEEMVEIEEGAFRGHMWAQPSLASLRARRDVERLWSAEKMGAAFLERVDGALSKRRGEGRDEL
ncbi:hypothetical protein TeGR_g9163 [Tetraparma gracilis]|uniref:Glycosyl transferase family 1 domain-containing protein n=1 Tax=Tetraparma gracilis TaxID=2962635 RepID=A0ABQ6MWW3_9STRA|nr:hypothetical protein TeGR_g9163 [Tetraparma gracilis]